MGISDSRRYIRAFFAAAALCAAPAPEVLAQDLWPGNPAPSQHTRPFFVNNGMYPNFGMLFSATMFYSYQETTNNPEIATSDGFIDIEPLLFFRMTEFDWLVSDISLAPVTPPNPGEKRWFGDMGLTVNDLYYYRSRGPFAMQLGKFDVTFGQAQFLAPGLFAGDFIAYDFTGMLGASVSYRFNAGELGTIQPIADVHFVDTTFLSRSYIHSTPRVKKSDGGPANTERPNSFTFAVNWNSMPALPNLQTQGGFIFNHRGVGDNADEYGFVGSALYPFTLGESSTLEQVLTGNFSSLVPFVEFAHFENKDGVSGADTSYLTTSLTAYHGSWAVGATRSSTFASGPGKPKKNDFLNEISLLYIFDNLMALEVSVGQQRQDDVKQIMFGTALSYGILF